MTSWEFAQAMDISYHTAMRWLKFGIVPGAVKAENNRDWIVPESALKMKRPVPGPKPDAGIVRTRAESAQIAKLRTEIELQKNEISGLQKILADKDEAITEICADLKSLQAELKKAEDTIAYKDREIDKVWTKVRELQAEITSLSDQPI